MLSRIASLLVGVAVAATALPSPAIAAPGAAVVYRGSCVVRGGIRTQTGAPVKAWDMWQEIFSTGTTWLAAHTHHGAECIMNVSGVTSWWFAHGDASPSAPPTIVPASTGKTVYTVQGRVHTAGNLGPGSQAYLGIHLLEQGSSFSYPSSDPSAPPVPPTKNQYISIFKNEMPNQSPSAGTVTIANQIVELRPGASYTIQPSPALGYYTIVCGGASMTQGGAPVAMPLGKTMTLPRNTGTTITASAMRTMLVATELIPGAHPSP
jgi:hypothetical protein